MALPERIEKLQQEILNIQEELLPRNREAVFIKDPKKRRKCPLCQQNLYLYYINFEEMFLMCENSYCDFPLGYEALQIVRDESELQENPVKASKDFFEYPRAGEVDLSRSVDSILGAPTCTLSSVSCLSDCDRFSQVGDSDDMSLEKQELLTARLSRQEMRRKQQLQKNKEVANSLQRIKELTEEMNQLIDESENYDSKVIRNKKWLQNLKMWEGTTGQKLLRDRENVQLVKIEPVMPKLTLDPTSGGTEQTTLNINIVVNKSIVDEGKEESQKQKEDDK